MSPSGARPGTADEGGKTVAGRIEAVSFDFANTLVPVSSASFRVVVGRVVDGAAQECHITNRAEFLVAWAEERDRQFNEDVPEGREVDLPQRVARVLARIRGMAPPSPEQRWDDRAVLQHSTPAEVDLIVDLYTRSFVDANPPPSEVTALLGRLASRGLRLAIVSNWPLAAAIDRYVEAAGWGRCLAAVVVSQRVGAIKPSRRIYAVAEREIGVAGGHILHVGDDWMADVVGAKRAGWRACYLRDQQPDWPRQAIETGQDVVPDLIIARLEDLEAGLDTLAS